MGRRPALIDWPSSHTLTTALLLTSRGPRPSLLLDLNLLSDDAARNHLDRLERLGFGIVRDPDRPLLDPIPGWSHLCWPSQVLVLATRGHGEAGQEAAAGKVLFEQVDISTEWYRAVGQNRQKSISLFVGNFRQRGRSYAAEDLREAATRRRLVGTTLPGIMAR
jgi:hypothetical protein